MLVMIGAAAVAGPLNFLIGAVLYALAVGQAPSGPGEAPLVIGSQMIAAAITIGGCVLAVSKLSSLPPSWGWLLGLSIAIATNPLVLFNVLGWFSLA